MTNQELVASARSVCDTVCRALEAVNLSYDNYVDYKYLVYLEGYGRIFFDVDWQNQMLYVVCLSEIQFERSKLPLIYQALNVLNYLQKSGCFLSDDSAVGFRVATTIKGCNLTVNTVIGMMLTVLRVLDVYREPMRELIAGRMDIGDFCLLARRHKWDDMDTEYTPLVCTFEAVKSYFNYKGLLGYDYPDRWTIWFDIDQRGRESNAELVVDDQFKVVRLTVRLQSPVKKHKVAEVERAACFVTGCIKEGCFAYDYATEYIYFRTEATYTDTYIRDEFVDAMLSWTRDILRKYETRLTVLGMGYTTFDDFLRSL